MDLRMEFARRGRDIPYTLPWANPYQGMRVLSNAQSSGNTHEKPA